MDLLRFATEMRLALYQCGQVARGLRGKVAREEKAPDSPHQMSTSVSVVDRLCQEILPLRAYEVAPYLEAESEELADCPEEILALFAGSRHRYALILDPVDGTGDYLEGKRTYAHMLGVLSQDTGRMGCGMIYFPEAVRFYTAIRGLGAFVAEGFWRLGAMVMRHFHGHDSAVASVIIEALGGAALGAGGQPVRHERHMPRMPLVVLSLVPDYAQELLYACAG